MNTTFEVRSTTGRTTLQTPTVWPSPTLTRHQHYWHRRNKVKIIYFLLAGTEGFHVRDEGPCRGPTTVALDKVEEKPGQHNGCLTDDWIRGLCTRETDTLSKDGDKKQTGGQEGRWRQTLWQIWRLTNTSYGLPPGLGTLFWLYIFIHVIIVLKCLILSELVTSNSYLYWYVDIVSLSR